MRISPVTYETRGMKQASCVPRGSSWAPTSGPRDEHHADAGVLVARCDDIQIAVAVEVPKLHVADPARDVGEIERAVELAVPVVEQDRDEVLSAGGSAGNQVHIAVAVDIAR